ncbi:MAG: MFS transporter [Acidimicrobiia bacterium]
MSQTDAPAGSAETPARGPSGDGVWAPHRRRLTLGLVLTITLVAFESLAVSTVMPVVADDLGDLGLYGWVFSGFFLGSLLGIVTAGRSADARGTAFPFTVGLALFSAGLLVGGLATSMPVLVAARVAQGIGAGAIPAVAYTSVGRAYPQQLRPRVFAVFSSAWVIPGLIGPAAAGAIEHALSWRAVFLALLPIVAVAAAMTIPQLSRRPPAPAADAPAATAGAVGDGSAATSFLADEDGPADPDGAPAGGAASVPDPPAAGAITAGVGRPEAAGRRPVGTGAERRGDRVDQRVLALVLIAGVTGILIAANGVPLPLTVLLLLAGVPLAAGAFLRLVPPGTARLAAGMPAAVMVRGILTFAFFGTDAFVSLTYQDVRDQPTWVAGAALTAATIAWTAAAWVQERWIHRVGPRRLVGLGFAFVGLGVVGMLGALGPLPVWPSILVWASAGFGTGLAYSPLSVTVLGLAEPGREGSASASLQLSDVLGTSLGTGASGAFVALGDSSGWALRSSLTLAFALTLAVAAGGVVAARRLPVALPADG